MLDAIKYWDTQLTSVAQAQVLDLGVGQVGSRALGTTMLDMFSDSIQAQASYREDVLNAKGGLIHQLVSYNFPRDDNLPQLRFGNVQRADIQAMARAFLALSQAGMSFGDETWDWVRDELNLPASDGAQVEVPSVAPAVPPPPAAPEPPAVPPAPKSDGDAIDDGAQASEAHTHGGGLRLAERRPAVGVEVYLDLAEITATFDTAKSAVRDATAATREALTAELVKRARVAAANGKLAKFAAGSPPMVDRLSADILAALTDFYDAGRRQVSRELQRQRDGRPWSAQSIRAAEVELAEGPSPEGLRALKQQAEAMGRAIATAVQAAAAMQTSRIATSVPIDESVREMAVGVASDGAALRFGATVLGDVMSLGRAAEAAAQAQDIEDAVYSAILDGNTCDACEPMDGETTTNLAEAEFWTPNPDCAAYLNDRGDAICRCLVVYEIRQGDTQ